jgi:phosphoglycerate dehydrogenase-like enzyme
MMERAWDDEEEDILPPSVRWAHVLGSGDNLLLQAMEGRLLTLSTTSAVARAVAEYVLGAMLAFEKHFPEIWLHEPPDAWN